MLIHSTGRASRFSLACLLLCVCVCVCVCVSVCVCVPIITLLVVYTFCMGITNISKIRAHVYIHTCMVIDRRVCTCKGHSMQTLIRLKTNKPTCSSWPPTFQEIEVFTHQDSYIELWLLLVNACTCTCMCTVIICMEIRIYSHNQLIEPVERQVG